MSLCSDSQEMRGGFGIMAAAGVSGHSEAGAEEAEASAMFCAVEPALVRGRPCPSRALLHGASLPP